MCGIGGIINSENKNIDLVAGAQIIGTALRHRGPDDEGFLFFKDEKKLCAYSGDTQKRSIGNAFNFSAAKHVSEAGQDLNGVFIHRRLAIIDVNESGHQPMCTANAKIWITYNGEIYNYIELRAELENFGYTFRTQSDTEVLLNAYSHWGTACLEKLNGMFAFSLWDSEKKKIFCARDRSGVKPFYYYFKDGVFCFASELKALRKLPFVETSLNERALQHYLLHDAIEYEPEGFLKNIFELFPSHFLLLDLSVKEITIKKYYEVDAINDFQSTNGLDLLAAKNEVHGLVTDAIVKRMRSDVPVGCCLSGGIDSSVISGVMSKHSSDLNTFTAVFPGESIDESKYAKEVADFTKAKWHTVNPNEKELEDDLEDLIYALDIPIWSTSTYAQFRVMQLAKQNNCKVVLDGQGGDELFGGYTHYLTTYINELMRNGQFKLAMSEIKSLNSNFWFLYAKENAKRKLHYSSNKKYLNTSFIKAFSEPEGLQTGFNSLQKHLQYDFFRGRLKTYLRCEDRCSMWHSVESRTPFADDSALLGYVFKIPAGFKIKNGVGKYILRESMKDVLPLSVYNRRDKLGFVTPHNRWLSSLLKKYAELPQNIHLRGVLNHSFHIKNNQLLNKNNQLPNGNNSKEESFAFKILVFSLWAKAFDV